MNNPVKVVAGMLLGAGIGAAISKIVGGSRQDDAALDHAFGVSEPTAPRETLKQRLERARLAGETAKAEKEEELRSYFRAKVKDQQAMRENPRL